jgi:predicted 3-demethylubiquinone-9 3-methyltransferase (glyoxalase superfamily)
VIAELLGLEICAENIQVQESPDFWEALSGPINCGQQAETEKGWVSEGLHGSAMPGILAVTLML